MPSVWKMVAVLGTAVALVHCAEPETPPSEQTASSGPDRITPPGTSRTPSFAELDADGDGYLTADETRQAPDLREIFSQADSDQDRKLSVAEFSQATREGAKPPAHAVRGPLFPALDRDENGRISRDEAHAVPALAERFDEADRDGSGGLDVQEYADAVDAGFTR